MESLSIELDMPHKLVNETDNSSLLQLIIRKKSLERLERHCAASELKGYSVRQFDDDNDNYNGTTGPSPVLSLFNTCV